MKYIFLHILNYHSFDKEGERRKFKGANVPEHRARSIDYSDSFGFHKACVKKQAPLKNMGTSEEKNSSRYPLFNVVISSSPHKPLWSENLKVKRDCYVSRFVRDWCPSQAKSNFGYLICKLKKSIIMLCSYKYILIFFDQGSNTSLS